MAHNDRLPAPAGGPRSNRLRRPVAAGRVKAKKSAGQSPLRRRSLGHRDALAIDAPDEYTALDSQAYAQSQAGQLAAGNARIDADIQAIRGVRSDLRRDVKQSRLRKQQDRMDNLVNMPVQPLAGLSRLRQGAQVDLNLAQGRNDQLRRSNLMASEQALGDSHYAYGGSSGQGQGMASVPSYGGGYVPGGPQMQGRTPGGPDNQRAVQQDLATTRSHGAVDPISPLAGYPTDVPLNRHAGSYTGMRVLGGTPQNGQYDYTDGHGQDLSERLEYAGDRAGARSDLRGGGLELPRELQGTTVEAGTPELRKRLHENTQRNRLRRKSPGMSGDEFAAMSINDLKGEVAARTLQRHQGGDLEGSPLSALRRRTENRVDEAKKDRDVGRLGSLSPNAATPPDIAESVLRRQSPLGGPAGPQEPFTRTETVSKGASEGNPFHRIENQYTKEEEFASDLAIFDERGTISPAWNRTLSNNPLWEDQSGLFSSDTSDEEKIAAVAAETGIPIEAVRQWRLENMPSEDDGMMRTEAPRHLSVGGISPLKGPRPWWLGGGDRLRSR